MRRKNCWVLLFFVLTGIVLGGFLGTVAQELPGLSWLGFGQTFGFDTPIVMNLGILVITFGLNIKITMAGIAGMALALIAYRFI